VLDLGFYKLIGDFFKNDVYMKWLIRGISSCLVMFFVWQLIEFEWDAEHGKYVKFLWCDRNIPEAFIKHDTVLIVKYDSVRLKV
jgi:hypothetical protein